MASKVGHLVVDISANTAKLVDGMNRAEHKMTKSMQTMKKSVRILGTALASLGGISAMGSVIKSSINTADAMSKLSTKLAVTTEELSKLSYAGSFVDVSLANIDSGFSAMIRRLNNFKRDGTGTAVKAMKELGISVEFAKENFTSVSKTFEIISQRLSQLPAGFEKTALAQDIFSKSASGIIRLSNLGAEGLKKLGDEAQKTGNVISTSFAKSAEATNDQMTALGKSFDGIVNKITASVLPSLRSVLSGIEDILGVQRTKAKFELQEKMLELNKEILSNTMHHTNNSNIYIKNQKRLYKEIESEYNLILEKEERLKKKQDEARKNQQNDTSKTTTIQNQKKQLESLAKTTDEISSKIGKSLEDSITTSLTQAITTGKASFDDFFRSVMNQITQIVVRTQIATPLANSFINYLNKPNAGQQSDNQAIENDAQYAVELNAKGGIVNRTTSFLNSGRPAVMGEAGAEAIMPLSRINGNLGVQSKPSSVVLNITNKTSSNIQAKQISELTRQNQNGQSERVIGIVLDGIATNSNGLRDAIKNT